MLRQLPTFERVPLAVMKKIIKAKRTPKRAQSSKQKRRKRDNQDSRISTHVVSTTKERP